MKNLLRTGLFANLILLGFASAEVTDADSGGFTIVNEVIIDASRDTVWRGAIDEIGSIVLHPTLLP